MRTPAIKAGVGDAGSIFKPGVRIAAAGSNVQVSDIDGEPVVLTPGKVYANFRDEQYSKPIKLPLPEKIDPQYQRTRANQWKLLDWEGDGDLDVIVGLGVWDDYGWDDAWDEDGNWKNGPLHGFVYLVENQSPVSATAGTAGTEQFPLRQRLESLATARFAEPRKLTTSDGNVIDVYGMPSPSFADFDGDGDFDLICGEFLDGFTYFENVGTRAEPKFVSGRRLVDASDANADPGSLPPLRMHLQMITPVAVDWDGDGDSDLICGDEDGRVAIIANLGRKLAGDFGPAFASPRYFQQQAADLKFGALVTPVGVDWDADGDSDLVAGNSSGDIAFFENLDGQPRPKFAAPVLLETAWWHGPSKATHRPIREQAGPKGSIQGPCEAKWGYATLSVVDWDLNGSLDLVTNGIWGRVQVWTGRSAYTPAGPPQPVAVQLRTDGPTAKPEWTWWTPQAGELATQWRTTPCTVDWNGDDLTDLVMLDHEGYLALYERIREGEELVLLPPRRLFKITGPCEFDQRHKPVGDKVDGLLRLNANRAGGSGRRKLSVVDWDGDGRLDLLVNSVNVNWLRNVRTDDAGFTWFEDMGLMDDRVLAGHTTSPTTVDWDQNGIPDLLVGAEDGRLYFKQNPRSEPTEIERRRLSDRR
ncbi:MAG: VCBS repeat-containing protein [Planctomycetaceae bacterium]